MKNYSKKEVEAAKARNTHGQDVVGVGAGGTDHVWGVTPAANASARFAQYVDTMIAEGISFADAHYTLNGFGLVDGITRPDQSPDVKRHLTFDQQKDLLEFVRKHEQWDKQEREAVKVAEAARRKQYESLKAEFEPDKEED